MDKRTRAKFSSIADRLDALEQGGSGAAGSDGGYYIPDVDGDGNLTWEASKSTMPTVGGTNIKGPQGPVGATGATGATGAQGPKGEAGPGVPTGGVAGQVLTKVDSTDYNTRWVTLSGEGTSGESNEFSENTYTTFDSDVVSSGTVYVIKKLGWCQVFGTAVLTGTVADWTTILDNTKIPAPQHGKTMFQAINSWSASYTRPARVSISAAGNLMVRYGAAFELNFSFVYPIGSEQTDTTAYAGSAVVGTSTVS